MFLFLVLNLDKIKSISSKFLIILLCKTTIFSSKLFVPLFKFEIFSFKSKISLLYLFLKYSFYFLILKFHYYMYFP